MPHGNILDWILSRCFKISPLAQTRVGGVSCRLQTASWFHMSVYVDTMWIPNHTCQLFSCIIYLFSLNAHFPGYPCNKNVQEWYTARVTSYFTIKPLTKVILEITDQSLFYTEIREAKEIQATDNSLTFQQVILHLCTAHPRKYMSLNPILYNKNCRNPP